MSAPKKTILQPEGNHEVDQGIPKDWKASHANLHQAVSWVGVLATEKTLNKVRLNGTEMYWGKDGIVLVKNGKEALIPAPNVALVVKE